MSEVEGIIEKAQLEFNLVDTLYHGISLVPMNGKTQYAYVVVSPYEDPTRNYIALFTTVHRALSHLFVNGWDKATAFVQPVERADGEEFANLCQVVEGFAGFILDPPLDQAEPHVWFDVEWVSDWSQASRD